jgi:hypothetical protein
VGLVVQDKIIMEQVVEVELEEQVIKLLQVQPAVRESLS